MGVDAGGDHGPSDVSCVIADGSGTIDGDDAPSELPVARAGAASIPDRELTERIGTGETEAQIAAGPHPVDARSAGRVQVLDSVHEKTAPLVDALK